MKRKRLKLFIAGLFTVYIGVYLVLSLAGTYRPNMIGLNGIKDWIWLPRYFTSEDGRWRRGCLYTFAPLFWLDHHYWHNDWTGESGPRDETLPPRTRV
jgi:hypothetical protein